MRTEQEKHREIEHANCSICAGVGSPGFYTGCMYRDGLDCDGWKCDGHGNLTRPIDTAPTSVGAA